MAEKAGAFLRGEVIEEFADTISEGAGGAPAALRSRVLSFWPASPKRLYGFKGMADGESS
jgi:hypothetical protein